ncbi:sterol-4alpha-methyl oxidase 1-1 [Prunus dulcis]|uniref:Sterol-4alpha-methyl oxidase 1-1 n=1 Tax=Prunus dulcis TaxID=3755 RepID=A0A4Y1RG66_PRUDU|nr:sterol-4alpha-methyl oxidase 1-1 [Prunus dulcis]
MLPYQTLEEAASALGRNLTFAETLWFNYSASKSDYVLYLHNILFLFVIFSVVPLPLVFAEVLSWAGLDRYKIQPKVRLPFSDMLKCYKDVMRMFILIVGPLQLVSYPSVQVRISSFGFFEFQYPILWNWVLQNLKNIEFANWVCWVLKMLEFVELGLLGFETD